MIYYRYVRHRRKASDPLNDFLSNAGLPENPHFAFITEEVNEYHVKRVENWLGAYSTFAADHPSLAPYGWLALVRQPSHLEPDVSMALLSAAYELSDENNYFHATSSRQILCSYLELPCDSLELAGHSAVTVNRVFNLLLHLGRSEDGESAFHRIRVDPKLLSSDLPRFLKLIEMIVRRGHFNTDRLWRTWVKALRVKTRGIRANNLEALIDKTKAMFAAEDKVCEAQLTESDDDPNAQLALPGPTKDAEGIGEQRKGDSEVLLPARR